MYIGQQDGVVGRDISFRSIGISLEHPTLDESISIIKSSTNTGVGISDVKIDSAIETIIDEGLISSSKSLESSKVLIDFYKNCQSESSQKEIIGRLVLAQKTPILEDIVEELLSDQNTNSFSAKLDETTKKDLVTLIKADVENRPQLLLRQIEKTNNMPNSKNQEHQSKNPRQPCDPVPVDEPGHKRGHFILQLLRTLNTPGDGGKSPDDLIKDHLKHLAKENYHGFWEELCKQMIEDPDFGRKMGVLIRDGDDNDFRKIMTQSIIEMFPVQSKYSVFIRNLLSFVHQIGPDTAIPYMSKDIKSQLVPRLMGNTSNSKILFGTDDILCRIEAGEFMTLNTLAQEGPAAIPILMNIRLKHVWEINSESNIKIFL